MPIYIIHNDPIRNMELKSGAARKVGIVGHHEDDLAKAGKLPNSLVQPFV
jgi:hypothetical protein